MMPRQRMLKPDIWTDEGFLSLSIPARLLFIGMISGADDEGRGLATDRCLKARIFPGDDVTLEQIRQYRNELQNNVNIEFYEVERREYYQLTKWEDHQKVEHLKASTLPSPPLHRILTAASPSPGPNELINELTNIPAQTEVSPSSCAKPVRKLDPVVAYFVQQHQEEYQFKPEIRFPQVGKLLKNLRKRYTDVQLCELIKFARGDPWIREKKAYDLATILSATVFNRLYRESQSERIKREKKEAATKCKGCGLPGGRHTTDCPWIKQIGGEPNG